MPQSARKASMSSSRRTKDATNTRAERMRLSDPNFRPPPQSGGVSEHPLSLISRIVEIVELRLGRMRNISQDAGFSWLNVIRFRVGHDVCRPTSRLQVNFLHQRWCARSIPPPASNSANKLRADAASASIPMFPPQYDASGVCNIESDNPKKAESRSPKRGDAAG